MNKINRNIWILRSKLMGFKEIGYRSCIYKPLQIDNANTITIGKRVYIAQYSWLMGSNDNSNTGLVIENNTTIGHFAHIIAYKDVCIEKSVLLADKVFISDCNHAYKNIRIPIQDQGIEFIKPVRIGEGTWIGENVCVCGANIGKQCVIGANSVVTKDIPDYAVAVGNPAKVIKIIKENEIFDS